MKTDGASKSGLDNRVMALSMRERCRVDFQNRENQLSHVAEKPAPRVVKSKYFYGGQA